MDTRLKIVEPRSIPRGRPVRIVVSYLDPLWSDQVAALRRHASPGVSLVVAVDDPPEPLLPAQARAELAAGLSFVDAVLLGEAVTEGIEGAERIDLRSADLERRRNLTEQVLRRHRSE